MMFEFHPFKILLESNVNPLSSSKRASPEQTHRRNTMKKSVVVLTVLTSLMILTLPTYARETHAGRPPIGLGGGVSIASRETHAGKPTNPGASVSGSVGTMSSGSIVGGGTFLGSDSSFGTDPYISQSPSYGGGLFSNGGYAPVYSPVQGFQWFFSILLFGPAWFF